MNELLQRAYDALQQADAAGNAEDAQKLADYIRELEAQAMVQEEKKAAPADDSGLHNPMTYGLAGAAAGRLLGPAVGAGIDTAAQSMMGRKPPAPGAAPAAPAAAPRMEPSMAPPQPARLSEPPSLLDEPAIKSISHNTQQVIGHPAAMSLARKPEPGFEVRPGRLIATPEGADLSVEAPPPQPQAPPTRSAAQLSAPPAATPPAAPPKPSMLSRMSRNLAEPKKAPLYIGGAMAAGQGRDAYEQAREGNIGQAALSGAGAVGGLGMLSRIKPIRAAGTLMGLGVPLARMYKSLTEDEEKEKVERRAAGGLAGYSRGSKVVKEIAAGKTPQALEDVLKFFKPKETKMMKASEALAPHYNKYLGLGQTDNFGVHGGRMGGNQFPNFQNISPLHARDRVVWMNDAEKQANDMVKNSKINGKDVIFSTYIGAPDQLKSNKTVTKDIYENFLSRNWTPEQYEFMNNYVATARKGKKGEEGPLIFPQPFDVRDKFAVQELGMDTFDRRAALASMLGRGEGIGGRRAGYGLENFEDILRSHRDPLTEGVPTSSVGTRLFSVDPTPAKFSKEYHPDYNWAVFGEDMGVQFPPVQQKLIVPQWYARTEAKSPGKNRTHGNAWFSYMKDPQLISHELLMGLEKEGLKKGGLVQYAKGGKTAAWQRKEGKNPEGGLNAKGRASYHAETGGTLKRPQPEGGARRDSFCSRMKGMKKMLTSAETANDPDSRINKALRKWKC
jgi:hypothetical protein